MKNYFPVKINIAVILFITSFINSYSQTCKGPGATPPISWASITGWPADGFIAPGPNIPYFGTCDATSIGFWTNSVIRLSIFDGVGGGPITGLISMGNGFRFAQSRLHLHEATGGTFVYTQWTNAITAPGALTGGVSNLEGMRVGLSAIGDGEMRTDKPFNLRFFTNGVQHIHIVGNAGANQGFIGINNTTPGNKVEITSGIAPATLNPVSSPGVATRSGLQFTNLTSLMTEDATDNTQPSHPIPTVLSVNEAGDVILVQGGGGFGLCPTPTVLAGDAGIDLNGNNFIFAGVNGNVKIGGPATCSFPFAKLEVNNAANITGIDVTSFYTAAIDNIGIMSRATGGTNTNTGIFGRTSSAQSPTNWGVRGLADSPGSGVTLDARGGYFQARGFSGNNPNVINYGVYSSATGPGREKYGVYCEASGTGLNYGIRAVVPTGSVGFAGWFDGNVIRTGTDNFTSDMSLKENIDSIYNALNILMQLQTHRFNFKVNDYPQMSLPNGTHFGLIAQEVEPVIPELVTDVVHPATLDTLGNEIYPSVNFKTLNYSELIPFLIKAIQEQQAQINILQSAKTSNSNLPSQSGVLSSEAILYQNTPNPFGDATSIAYYLPDNVVKAQMIFFDIYGKEIKTIELANRGDAKVDLTTSDLASGIYTYRLVADGTVVKTLQMVRAK